VTILARSLLASATFFCAVLVAIIIGRVASSVGLVDVPNERSSHSRPTPRGGGLGIFIGVAGGIWYCAPFFRTELSLPAILLGGGAVAMIGLWDDIRSVPVRLRLVVHVLSGILLVAAFPNGVTIHILKGFSFGGIPAAILSCLGVVCLINMFNFMDGIDGLAAMEAVFVAGAGALLIFGQHVQSEVLFACVLISSASAGFAIVNWPPARVFMGDVGSGFLGFAIAAVALWTETQQIMPIWTWFILGSVFIADAAVTLFRRWLRGEQVASAHRMHAYQRLARRWSSHGSVTVVAVLINCIWLFPLAMLSMLRPEWAAWIAVLALIPIGIAVWICGAGLPD
jgi:Fuc2NAc and GlcNAc transferase